MMSLMYVRRDWIWGNKIELRYLQISLVRQKQADRNGLPVLLEYFRKEMATGSIGLGNYMVRGCGGIIVRGDEIR